MLVAERDGPGGTVRADAIVLLNAVKLSDDPDWPDCDGPGPILWED